MESWSCQKVDGICRSDNLGVNLPAQGSGLGFTKGRKIFLLNPVNGYDKDVVLQPLVNLGPGF